MSEALQLLIVGLVVALCAWRAIKRYAPKAAWRVQASLSLLFEKKSRPAWSQAIGRWLRPAETASGDGCGSGCSTCGGCATNSGAVAKTTTVDGDPLRIHLRR